MQNGLEFSLKRVKIFLMSGVVLNVNMRNHIGMPRAVRTVESDCGFQNVSNPCDTSDLACETICSGACRDKALIKRPGESPIQKSFLFYSMYILAYCAVVEYIEIY